MRKEEKAKVVEVLSEQIKTWSHLYIADIEGLNAKDTSNLRRKCFENDIKLAVVKNTLLKLALEQAEGEYKDLYNTLVGNTTIMFSNTGNAPAKLIKEFRKSSSKPILKAAYVEESVYVGDNQLDALVSVKTKNELIGDIVLLLQSPAKNVISALQSSGHILSGLVKTLSEREEK